MERWTSDLDWAILGHVSLAMTYDPGRRAGDCTPWFNELLATSTARQSCWSHNSLATANQLSTWSRVPAPV